MLFGVDRPEQCYPLRRIWAKLGQLGLVHKFWLFGFRACSLHHRQVGVTTQTIPGETMRLRDLDLLT